MKNKDMDARRLNHKTLTELRKRGVASVQEGLHYESGTTKKFSNKLSSLHPKITCSGKIILQQRDNEIRSVMFTLL